MLKKFTRIRWVQSILAYKIYLIIILIKKLSSWKTINRKAIISATSQKNLSLF